MPMLDVLAAGGNRRPAPQPITMERVRNALVVAARLVEHGGDTYLPIFERLERELAGLEEKRSAVERARVMARAAV